MHAIYFLFDLCFNNNIKFKVKLYSNYSKIVYTHNIYIIYFLFDLCFNNNIKFKVKLYSNYSKIVYTHNIYILLFNIYLLIRMFIIYWTHESQTYINDT